MSVSEPAPRPSAPGTRHEVALVALGYEPAGLFEGADPVTAARYGAGDDAVGELVSTLRAALESAPRVIVVYAAWLPAAALRDMQTARAALDTGRIALVASDLPPLAGGVLSVLAGALAPHVGAAGRLVGALDVISSELIVLAWLRSVSGLKRPSPSMLQHAASLVARRGWGVRVQPEPSVRRLPPTKEFAVAAAPQEMALVVADRGGDMGWVTNVVNPALGGLQVRALPAPEHGPTWWGTGRLTEIVAYPTDLEALADRATAGRRVRACGWCDARVTLSPCPFCGHTV